MEDLNYIEESIAKNDKVPPKLPLITWNKKITQSHTSKCSKYSLVRWLFTSLIYRVWATEDFSKEVV